MFAPMLLETKLNGLGVLGSKSLESRGTKCPVDVALGP